MKFTYLEKLHERKPQEFDKDNIFWVKNGKKVNVYQTIQEANVDCEPYEVLEKYGCIDKLQMDPKLTYGDFTEIQKERSPYEAKLKADQMWNNLPFEVRQQFDHDSNKFMKEGESWLQEQIKKLEPAEMPISDTTEPKGNNNE